MIIILLSLSSFLFIIVLILIIYNLIITKKYKYFQSIIETIPEAVLIFIENGKIVDGNNSFLKMFKYHSKELHDISVKNIFEENNISDFLKNSISKQEINKAFHLTGKKKSGEQFFIDVKFKKMKIRKISYILAAISDVAENKAIEKKLRESQRLLSTLISNLPGIAYLSHNDENRSKIFISEGCYELTGYNPSDIIDNKKINFAELIHPDDRKYVWNEVQRAISEKRAFLLTYRIKNAQGQEKWVWEKGRAIFTSEKKLLGLGGFIADITEYKHLEEALATEKERLAVTLRSIADGVITTDIKGKVILINNVAEKLTGWAYEKAQNKDLNKVFCVINEKTRKICKNPFEKVLESGRIIDIANHSVLISKDGTERQIEDSGAPIKDKNNNIIGVVIVFRDVTEKYKMEEKIAKILKLESLGILAGGIAHDFNNILTPILGNINLAKMYSDKNKELYGLLSEAEKAIHNMKGLTDQLLTFAKGGTTIKKTGSVKKILQENVSFSLRGSNIKYNFLVNNNLWLIDFDEGQMSQVFNNLAINARQAMPKGGCLSISADNFFYDNTSIPFLKKGKYVKIIFEDQGRGIHKEYISKIFDPFFTTKKRGRGLGLASVYSIIKKHDGLIDVESKVKEGTRFFIYLPASIDRKNSDFDFIKKEIFIKGKGRILYMDDELAIREMLKKTLEFLGYEVESTKDGLETIEKYKIAIKNNKPYDCVILDLTIPGGMGGKETMAKLLKIDPKVNTIVSSGYSNDPIIGNYKKYGFKGVVTKPFKIEELSKILNTVLKK